MLVTIRRSGGIEVVYLWNKGKRIGGERLCHNMTASCILNTLNILKPFIIRVSRQSCDASYDTGERSLK